MAELYALDLSNGIPYQGRALVVHVFAHCGIETNLHPRRDGHAWRHGGSGTQIDSLADDRAMACGGMWGTSGVGGDCHILSDGGLMDDCEITDASTAANEALRMHRPPPSQLYIWTNDDIETQHRRGRHKPGGERLGNDDSLGARVAHADSELCELEGVLPHRSEIPVLYHWKTFVSNHHSVNGVDVVDEDNARGRTVFADHLADFI